MSAQLPPIAIPASWADAISTRVSRRSYLTDSLDPAATSRLNELCANLSGLYPDARAVLVNEPDADIFTGIVGAYGVVIQHAPAFVALVGSGAYVEPDPTGATDPNRKPMYSDLSIGRIGEAIVLEATSLNLGTCWVAGSFDRTKAERYVAHGPDELLRAVTPVGTAAPIEGAVQRAMQALVKARTRLPLDTIAPASAQWPAWARDVARMVQAAPSGKNGQPWRMRVDGGSLVLAHETGAPLVATYMADMGIALMHAEVALASAGQAGEWRISHPDATGEVARFTPAGA